MDHTIFSLLERFPRLKVLVVGEAILDSMVRGQAGRLSLEAPVPVVDVSAGQDLPGGAANTAAFAAQLGAKVELLSVTGADTEGEILLDLLRERGVCIERVICRPERRTLLRRRIYAEGRLVVRYDQGSREPLDERAEAQLLREIDRRSARADVVILSDYGQGILTPGVLAGIARLQQERPGMLLAADTRRLDEYRGLRLAAVRPSFHSALEMTGRHSNGHDEALEKVRQAGRNILQSLKTQVVAITLDDNGALVLDRGAPAAHRTYAQATPFNKVNGAGDAFIGALALGLAAGRPANASEGDRLSSEVVSAAAEIASAFAGMVVANDGAPACCLDELRAKLAGDEKLFETWAALAVRLDALRKQGKRIVFTNGVFDILHSAHVAYLDEARSFGDVLVVGVNSDESVRRLKGPSRPINALLERSRVLAGLSCIDCVASFGQDNPIELIHVVQPDVYVKGGDYTRDTLPEAEVVESYGGELRIIDYIANHSTTGVIEKIRERYD